MGRCDVYVNAGEKSIMNKYLWFFSPMQRLGRRCIQGAKIPSTEKDVDDEVFHKKLIKFKESSWKCLYYLTAEIFALVVTYKEPWFTDSKQFWVGPGDQCWPDQMTRFSYLSHENCCEYMLSNV